MVWSMCCKSRFVVGVRYTAVVQQSLKKTNQYNIAIIKQIESQFCRIFCFVTLEVLICVYYKRIRHVWGIRDCHLFNILELSVLSHFLIWMCILTVCECVSVSLLVRSWSANLSLIVGSVDWICWVKRKCWQEFKWKRREFIYMFNNTHWEMFCYYHLSFVSMEDAVVDLIVGDSW